MATDEEKAFIGVRIEPREKRRLEQQAEEQSISLNEHCKRLLNGARQDAGTATDAVAEYQEHAGEWEELVDELTRLEAKREELKEIVNEQSGLFTNAPLSLRTALRAAEHQINLATKKLASMCPTESDDF